MKVLLIGSGGREDAMAQAISKSPLLDKLYIAPGNGGSPCERVNIKATDIEGVVGFAKEKSVKAVFAVRAASLRNGRRQHCFRTGPVLL